MVVGTWSTALTTDTISTSFSAILEAGESYTLDYYADKSANGACDAYPADHVWHDALGTPTGDTSARIDHNGGTIDSDGCNSF